MVIYIYKTYGIH